MPVTWYSSPILGEVSVLLLQAARVRNKVIRITIILVDAIGIPIVYLLLDNIAVIRQYVLLLVHSINNVISAAFKK
jgi:hypothetical protein